MYISKKEFTEWSKTAREKRKLCEEGQITLAEFQTWLDESKCRYSLDLLLIVAILTMFF